MSAEPFSPSHRESLRTQYHQVRRLTERLCEPLVPDDYLLQSMPECSPPKWHLAHSTWFFETFVLASFEPGFRPFHPLFSFLFNSYYEAVGERWPRPARGLLSRPASGEVFAYRHDVNKRMAGLLETADEVTWQAITPIVELGINHEQQHQELLLTDLKHAFGLNPLRPVYLAGTSFGEGKGTPLRWTDHPAGVRSIGHAGAGFVFDNESPRHRTFVERFQIASRPVTVEEFLEFIEDGGYDRPELWLADGWTTRQQKGWGAPLYWDSDAAGLRSVFTLRGQQPLNMIEPVCHVSYYEADAFARWAGARLPTEAEWEIAAGAGESPGHFLESGRFHPAPDNGGGQFFGDVWEWTASPYAPYPGYRPASGALGEYNGKFMCNQMVLRGGSCVTPARHVRPTYRNFFPPDARWQFSGFRLAKDGPS
ncbi:ergothioneine biosynthesis protein EgtB [Zavarzinella formosa]|uniref:ergothioneine biosynthesis protein EgtB n=1 Tax=Zavarzinella formosa TaxID=360055 RepID=UPI000314142E|nr:ergothioneine biosynthesis protein EgtB [Zavarzinella formosa]